MATGTTSNDTDETFTSFYDGWLLRHQQLQQQLLTQINHNNEDVNKVLIKKASDHYREYYNEKSIAIQNDVFLVCSPPWYTSFEQALFWVTDFPPSIIFRFLSNLSLTSEQAQKVDTMKEESVRKEWEIGEAMAMVQETMAAAPLYGLVNRAERLVDGEVSKLDDAMEEVKEAMRVVVMEADGLRWNTVVEVLNILDVFQKVDFFAAVGEFHIRTRRVGLQMNSGRTTAAAAAGT